MAQGGWRRADVVGNEFLVFLHLLLMLERKKKKRLLSKRRDEVHPP